MTVKTIFKVLFTTMVTMVLSLLLVELFNVSVTSFQLRQISRMAARQACILFTSETYKGSNSVGGNISIQDVKTCDGTTWITGNFYGGDPHSDTYKRDVWNRIYGDGDFQDFCRETPVLEKYYSFKILQMAAKWDNSLSVPTVTWDSSDAEIENAVKMSMAEMYYNNYYTTANIGIPYMHDEIVNHMYRWNLAQLLSNCNPDSIQKDDNGNWCVNFRGFKIYADQCEIKNYDYRVYDVSPNSSNRSDEERKLWEDLNIDATDNHRYLGARADAKGMIGHTTTVVGAGSDGHGNIYDNYYVTSVGIEYNLVANYEGITPLRKLIAYVFNNQVAGKAENGGNSNVYTGPGTSLVTGSATDTISLGGFSGNKQADGSTSAGVVTSGKLTYTLDR